MTDGTAEQRWREQLAAWAIPPEILATAPRSPWELPVDGFVQRVREQRANPSPAARVAAEALAGGGDVLDVGCGAGAGSLPLVPPASRVTGVDESQAMLDAFGEVAASLGVEATGVPGRWPDIADEVDVHDVVVAHHVVYNVGDLGAFVRACDRHARRRVVLVLPTAHPMRWTAPYWRRLHGLERPDGPTVDDVVAVLTEAGIEPERLDWSEPHWAGEVVVAERVLVRLGLPEDRRPEVEEALAAEPPDPERRNVALWWQPRGASS